VKVPVFRFEEEVLTDAPIELIEDKLGDWNEVCSRLPRFRAIRQEGEVHYTKMRPWLGERDILLQPLDKDGERIRLQWFLTPMAGLEEHGGIEAWPEEGKTRLWLWGRLKGWPSLLTIGAVRFVSDQSLEKFVETL